jgi:hypothetical protein
LIQDIILSNPLPPATHHDIRLSLHCCRRVAASQLQPNSSTKCLSVAEGFVDAADSIAAPPAVC